MNSLELAKSIAEEASKAKALGLKILDLRKLSSFTDFFVICSGTSDRQMKAIADRAVEEIKKNKRRPLAIEGSERGQWILVDFGEVVLHVFSEESRGHYDLEGFWKKAPRVRVSLAVKGKKKTPRETQTSRRRKTQRPRTSRSR